MFFFRLLQAPGVSHIPFSESGSSVPVKLDELLPPLPVPPFTVRVNIWLAAAPTPLLAENVRAKVPPLPDAGVPLNVAVPFPLFTNVTLLGSAPVSVSDGVGVPVVVTVNSRPCLP